MVENDSQFSYLNIKISGSAIPYKREAQAGWSSRHVGQCGTRVFDVHICSYPFVGVVVISYTCQPGW